MTRRIIGSLLAILLMVFVFVPLLTFEVFATTMTIVVEKQVQGSEIRYSVQLPEKSQIAALQLEVVYDPLLVEYQSHTTGALFQSGMGQVNDKENGKILCVFITAMPLQEAGDFLECSFQYRGGKTPNVEPVSFDFAEIADSKGKTIDRQIRYVGFPDEFHSTAIQPTTTVRPTQHESTTTAVIPPTATTTVVAQQSETTVATVVELDVQTTNTDIFGSTTITASETNGTTMHPSVESTEPEIFTEDAPKSSSVWKWVCMVIIGALGITGTVIYILKRKGS